MPSTIFATRLDDDDIAWVDAQCEQRSMTRAEFGRFLVAKARAGVGQVKT